MQVKRLTISCRALGRTKLKIFILFHMLFCLPLVEGVIFGRNTWSNYLSPILLFFIIIAQKNSRSLERQKAKRNFYFSISLSWVALSLIFCLFVYDQKQKNILNLLSICLLLFSAKWFLPDKSALLFIRNICKFLTVFTVYNILIQIFLPKAWGESIFINQSGMESTTFNFEYIPLKEKLLNIQTGGPLSFPFLRSTGVGFLGSLLFSCFFSKIITKKTNKMQKYINILFCFISLLLIYLSNSRSAFLTVVAIGIASLRFVQNKSIIFLFLVLFLGFAERDKVTNFFNEAFKIKESTQETARGREELWVYHSDLLKDKPLTGWGWILPYDKYSYDNKTQATTESGFTFILASQGFIRGGLFLFMCLASIWKTRFITENEWERLFLHFASISLFFHCAFQGLLVSVTSPFASIAMVLFALALFSQQLSKKRRSLLIS